MAYNLILETSFLLDQKAMFSTIPLSQVVNSVVTDEKHSVSAGQQIVPTIEEPIAETHSSVVNDIPCSSSFDGEISHNLKAEDHTQTDGQVSHGQEVADVEHRTTLSDKEKTPEKEQQHCPLLSLEESLGNPDDEGCSKDNMSSLLDSESILVMMSSWNAKKGTKCVDSHASRIKFYQDTDIPLGKFLQDNLLNQKLQCWNCGETPEGHIFQYAHKGKLLTIQVHSLVDKSLPGESEGKLWMWSRYKCIYQDGGSKTTKRILVSSGSRGFSFGKFLQLSFSDSSLSSRLSSCSHSFHGDFLYFFGLGSVVATFKCSAVPTYPVSLPPLKLEFSSSIKEEFHKKIFEDVYMKGIRMFLDVEKALKAIEYRFNGTTLNLQGSALELSEVDKMLKEERSHFEVMVRPTTGGEETRHDFMVMENMFFGKNITRQYELKGTLHDRFNSADNDTAAVLLDQNFVNDMNVYPIYVAKSSHRNLQRAVWNDSAFLNSINVMDYSLLVGMDTQGNELVCGIIDYARQYTRDKQILNSFKSSLGVPENILPAVISPKEYKRRFRKFIDKHFPTVPEHW